MAKLVVLVTGNICAGKTTLVDYLENNKEMFSKFLAQDESLLVIKEFIDPESLKLFYQNRRKNTYIFEFSCLVGRIVRHQLAKEHKGIVIFDRGIIEGAETFAKNSFNEGYLSHQDYTSYLNKMKDSFDDLSRIENEQKQWLEQLVVYLDVGNTKVLSQRSKKRKTEGEEIPLEYLERINNYYNEYINNANKIYSSFGLFAPKVVKINASIDMCGNLDYLKNNAKLIIDEIEEILNGNKQKNL